MLDYAWYQARGYPMGNGSVESANKLVVERRLKGMGMLFTRSAYTPSYPICPGTAVGATTAPATSTCGAQAAPSSTPGPLMATVPSWPGPTRLLLPAAQNFDAHPGAIRTLTQAEVFGKQLTGIADGTT